MGRPGGITILALLAVMFAVVGHASRDLREATAGAAPYTTQYLSIAPSTNGGDYGTILDPHSPRKIDPRARPGLLPPGWPGFAVSKFSWWWPDWLRRRPFHDHLPQISITPGPLSPSNPVILP